MSGKQTSDTESYSRNIQVRTLAKSTYTLNVNFKTPRVTNVIGHPSLIKDSPTCACAIRQAHV